MDGEIQNIRLINQAYISIRIVFVTMAICGLFYPLMILGIGQTLSPQSANGSLILNDLGEIIGSDLIAQKFDWLGYFWPRPSAVDFNAAAAGGSNLSPANPELRARANALAIRLETSPDNPVPADLVTASGSGLDPDITLASARYQAARVASARGLSLERVLELLQKHARRPGGALTPQPLVNVLLVNIELDQLGK